MLGSYHTSIHNKSFIHHQSHQSTIHPNQNRVFIIYIIKVSNVCQNKCLVIYTCISSILSNQIIWYIQYLNECWSPHMLIKKYMGCQQWIQIIYASLHLIYGTPKIFLHSLYQASLNALGQLGWSLSYPWDPYANLDADPMLASVRVLPLGPHVL